MQNKYMPDDKVSYTGSKFKDIAGAQGWVITEVRNDPGLYVVEFGGDSYLIRSHLLTTFRASSTKEEKNSSEVHGIEIRRNRKRTAEDEE